MADLSQLNVNNTDYNLKDAAARNDIQSTQVVSGNPITLTDAAPMNAESLVVELEPKQDLHGQDAPYVGGAGKNKYNPDSYMDYTGGGNQMSKSGDTYSVSWVNGAVLFRGTQVFGSGEWAVSLIGDNIENVMIIAYTNQGGSVIDSGYGTLIFQASEDWIIGIAGNYTIESNATFKIQVENGSQATDYAPWENICPITGYTECEVDDVGKNKVDISETTTSSSDYVFNLTNLNIQQGTYTFSFDCTEDGNASFACGDDNTDFVNDPILVRGGKGAITFIATNTITQMRLYGYAATYSNIQLEEGSTATSYEPYHSSNATIQFGQTVYGGRSNFTDGGTDDEIAFIKDTHITNISEGSDGNADWLNVVFATDIDILLSDTVAHRQELAERSMSNYSGDWEYENVNGHVHFYSGARAIYAFYPKSVFPTLSDFTTYYANNKAKFAIPYETASTISTPPTELKLLKGINNITTNGTTIALGYQPDNVIGEVKGEIEQITEMDYLRILDNNVDTQINNYRIYYHLISGAYTLVNMGEMLNHRFIFVEVVKNPSGGINKKVLHSALIDPRTIDGFEYEMKASGNDTIWIESILDENRFNLSLRTTGGSYSDGDPTDYYVTIRMVD